MSQECRKLKDSPSSDDRGDSAVGISGSPNVALQVIPEPDPYTISQPPDEAGRE
ncbi:MAG TPA: hypothetical protein PLQ35_16030 [bacterium]|nr:hypothetical protein [bacterium]HQL63789.1 hypothetical protein [bacterium]